MAIFKQTKGSGATWFSTTLKPPYKHGQGQWGHGSYNLKQLEALVELAQQAIQFVTETEQTKDAEKNPLQHARHRLTSRGQPAFCKHH